LQEFQSLCVRTKRDETKYVNLCDIRTKTRQGRGMRERRESRAFKQKERKGQKQLLHDTSLARVLWFELFAERVPFLCFNPRACGVNVRDNPRLFRYRFLSSFFFFYGSAAQSGSRLPPLLMFLDHTLLDTHKHAVELLWTSDRLVTVAATYTTLNRHKRQTSVPSTAFEPAISGIGRLQTYVLDGKATEIGLLCFLVHIITIYELCRVANKCCWCYSL
jgi:hypothetical protein